MSEEHLKAKRSSGKHELKKFACRGLFLFFLMEMMLCAVLKPSILNLGQSVALGLRIMISLKLDGELPLKYSKNEIAKSIYNCSNARSDVYDINGDIRVANNLSTIFVPSSFQLLNGSASWTIRPYFRKYARIKLHPVREWKIQTRSLGQFPNCSRHFNAPAVLFSTGAFSMNYFHAFTDIFIPLYLTAQQFDGNVVLLISNFLFWRKLKYYKTILKNFTRYDIVDLDVEKEVLCFPNLIVGLTSNKDFSINPLEPPHYSMTGFTQFIRNVYSLKRDTLTDVRKPRMLLISRKKTRVLMNEGEVANMARELGFDVVVEEMRSNLTSVALFVNSLDVMVAVHGAGLTNMIFLPEKAVVIQITPFAVERIAGTYFGSPARDMNLRYMEYNATWNESSLAKKYPVGSEVCRDPRGIEKRKGWIYFHNLYFREQNVILDLVRFKATLLDALKLFGN